MKRAAALAVLDFAEIPAGLDATDAMLKKAPVAFFRAGTVTAGRYLTLVGGTPASVEEALAEGLAHAGAQLLDVGSSRVDLQACKLEYSIVSPK